MQQPPSPKVLVVDDHVDGADALADLLEMMGCQVSIAYSGADALTVAPNFQPEVVMLDLNMPGMSGCETAKRMRQQTWSAKAVLVAYTGSADDTMAESAKRHGIDHFLLKGTPIERVLEIVTGRPRR